MKKEQIRVALATNDLEQVDSKFETARQLVIYEVANDSSRFVEILQFDDFPDAEQQLNAKCDALRGCAALFVYGAPLGAVAAFHMVKTRVFAVKLQEVEPISNVIGSLQNMINNSPPLWLCKALKEGMASEAAAEVA